MASSSVPDVADSGWDDPQLLRVALEALPHPFYVIDVQTYSIALANGAARRLGVIVGGLCHVLTHGSAVPCASEEHPCPIDAVRRTHGPVVVEHRHHDDKLGLRDVEVHGFPIFDASGHLVRLVEYVVDITERKQLERDRERSLSELKAALAQVRSLEGLLPICAWCKRIRDDHGYWNEVEAYIHSHTGADFTHSICETCASQMYAKLRRGE